jgi:acetolactate synthase I/II/III large subunit
MTTQTKGKQTAGQLLVRSLVNQDVKLIFGVPGGKIMPTFDLLNEEGPKIIVCRHEQNAAFMAAAGGRLTGRPGLCLVTSGPGISNLVTGAATATSEGDPMVAIGGVVGQPEATQADAPDDGLCVDHETGHEVQRCHRSSPCRCSR